MYWINSHCPPFCSASYCKAIRVFVPIGTVNGDVTDDDDGITIPSPNVTSGDAPSPVIQKFTIAPSLVPVGSSIVKFPVANTRLFVYCAGVIVEPNVRVVNAFINSISVLLPDAKTASVLETITMFTGSGGKPPE